MNIEDVAEWIKIADDDFDSAQILNQAVRKHYEIICYHCAQAVEKYLKGYLEYIDVIPEKTHNLTYLNRICFDKDNRFIDIKTECDFLNRFANDIRYPHRYETKEADAVFCIDAVKKIRNFEPVCNLRNIVEDNKNDTVE
ncbi:MAG: HEPN domain-containing protein [Bacteroidales bacterium]|jgi:HEPN domain-containing protein|nr:HEPN domain-containing protein [Bacteroidales bacterium]